MTLPKEFPQFTVKPYAKVPRHKRGRFDPADDCCICGKRVTRRGAPKGAAGTAYIAGGGSRWATTGDGPEDGGWMGAHQVGSDCWRRYYVGSMPRAFAGGVT